MVSAEDGEANNNKADATANTRAIFLEGKVKGANIYICIAFMIFPIHGTVVHGFKQKVIVRQKPCSLYHSVTSHGPGKLIGIEFHPETSEK